MSKDKFNKGDLVWATLRGYGVVVQFSQMENPEISDSKFHGVGDYAEIRWQNNYQTKIFRDSRAWKETEVRARVEQRDHKVEKLPVTQGLECDPYKVEVGGSNPPWRIKADQIEQEINENL